MSNRTERDFSPDPREMARRRFMIAGEHIILRALEREDAERCYRWMNDPNVVRTLKSRYPIAFQNEMEWLERAMHPTQNERHFASERRDARKTDAGVRGDEERQGRRGRVAPHANRRMPGVNVPVAAPSWALPERVAASCWSVLPRVAGNCERFGFSAWGISSTAGGSAVVEVWVVAGRGQPCAGSEWAEHKAGAAVMREFGNGHTEHRESRVRTDEGREIEPPDLRIEQVLDGRLLRAFEQLRAIERVRVAPQHVENLQRRVGLRFTAGAIRPAERRRVSRVVRHRAPSVWQAACRSPRSFSDAKLPMDAVG